MLLAIGLAASAAALGDTIEMSGVVGAGIPAQMELTISEDDSVRGHFFLESRMRPRLLQGRVDRNTGRVVLSQFDQRCNAVAKLEGMIQGKAFAGTWSAEDGSETVDFQMKEQPTRLSGVDTAVACELKKGQFSSHFELAVRNGRLGQLTYLTSFVGGVDQGPWYCAVSSLDPGFQVEGDANHILVRDQANGSGCTIAISDTENLIKVQFRGCQAYCARTAFPHSLLIDKATGTCTEFAVPQGSCQVAGNR